MFEVGQDLAKLRLGGGDLTGAEDGFGFGACDLAGGLGFEDRV